jgi:hypothetical protein
MENSKRPPQHQKEPHLNTWFVLHGALATLMQEEAYLLDKVVDSHHCRYGDLAVHGRLARLASTSWSMVTFPQILKL